MKLSKFCKVELSASTDETRHAITEPFLDIAVDADGTRKGNLVSVDGRILAIVPVELDEHDAQGYVSPDVLKAARKAAFKGSNYATVTCNGKAELPNGVTMPRTEVSEGTQFPNWRQVTVPRVSGDIEDTMPAEDGTKGEPMPRTHTVVGIDIALLWKLAQSLGTDAVRLQIPVDGMGSIRVDSMPVKDQPSTGAYGVIMPMRLS